MIEEAAKSRCDSIRYGSEFCELKIPKAKDIEYAYEITTNSDKEFLYVTPRVTDIGIKKIKDNINFIKKIEKMKIIINDYGMLNMLSKYPNMVLILGRQLIQIPARCPWYITSLKDLLLFPIITISDKMERIPVDNIYSQTNLNYLPTIKFYRKIGVKEIDLDWIPRCFPSYLELVRYGFNISINANLIPVAITRKCHTARFLDENSPEDCTKPCYSKAYKMQRRGLNTDLYLLGNVVFRKVKIEKKHLQILKNDLDIILEMNPITKIKTKNQIDQFITKIPS
jgi:hypothetical protein